MSKLVHKPDRTGEADLCVGPSLFLDIVRLTAAIFVAVGHLSEGTFTVGSPHLIDLALHSVTAFFLLSGFVIRYVTKRRTGTLRRYLMDRLSRLYSVLLPALLFTVVMDVVAGLSSQFHAGTLGQILRGEVAPLLAELSFTTFIWHWRLGLFTDPSMWSLGFEWFYYVLYGVSFYLRSWKRVVWLCAVTLLAGPEILTLLPVWLLGCVMYECFMRSRQLRWLLPVLAGGSVALLALVAAEHSLRTHLVTLARSMMEASHNFEQHRAASHSPWYFVVPSLGHGSPASLSAYPSAVGCFWVMFLGLLLSDRIAASAKGRLTRAIRFLAEATFPLYLFHLPIFFLVVVAVGHPLASNAAKLALFLFTFVVSAAAGPVLDRFKLRLRGWMEDHAATGHSVLG